MYHHAWEPKHKCAYSFDMFSDCWRGCRPHQETMQWFRYRIIWTLQHEINWRSHAVIASNFGGKTWCDLIVDWRDGLMSQAADSGIWKAVTRIAHSWDSVSKSSNTWTPNWPKRFSSTQFICSESRTHTIRIYKKTCQTLAIRTRGIFKRPLRQGFTLGQT